MDRRTLYCFTIAMGFLIVCVFSVCFVFKCCSTYNDVLRVVYSIFFILSSPFRLCFDRLIFRTVGLENLSFFHRSSCPACRLIVL